MTYLERYDVSFNRHIQLASKLNKLNDTKFVSTDTNLIWLFYDSRNMLTCTEKAQYIYCESMFILTRNDLNYINCEETILFLKKNIHFNLFYFEQIDLFLSICSSMDL